MAAPLQRRPPSRWRPIRRSRLKSVRVGLLGRRSGRTAVDRQVGEVAQRLRVLLEGVALPDPRPLQRHGAVRVFAHLAELGADLLAGGERLAVFHFGGAQPPEQFLLQAPALVLRLGRLTHEKRCGSMLPRPTDVHLTMVNEITYPRSDSLELSFGDMA